MKEGKRNTVLLIVVSIATLLVTVVGATFAFFTAALTGQEGTTTVTVLSGSIGTVIDEGDAIIISNVIPQAESLLTKVITISHTNSITVPGAFEYSITLDVESNTFATDHLKYTFTHGTGTDATGTMIAETATQTPIGTSDITFGNATAGYEGSITTPTGPGGDGTEVSQVYNLDIFFPDTGTNQNASQGQEFKAHIVVVDVNA